MGPGAGIGGGNLLGGDALGAPGKRICPGLEGGQAFPIPACLSLSQLAGGGDVDGVEDDPPPAEAFHGFTQPAQLDNMLVSTQGATQSSQTTI